MAATTGATEEGQQPEEWGVDADEMPQEVLEVIDDREDEELSLDEIFGLLKNQRRREVLRYLRTAEEGTTTLDELAEHIAAKENDIEVKRLSSDQRKRVYIGLYQCHLPKMDEAGVIDYDKDRGVVRRQEVAEQLEPYLIDATEETGDRFPVIELGATGSIVAVLTVGAVGIGPLAAVPAAAWVAFSTAALALLALYQISRR